MTKRKQQALQKQSDAVRAEAGPTTPQHSAPAADDKQFVVFQVAGESFGFPLAEVAEILRPPALAHMPLGPKSLMGLANLRGLVLPVVGLRRLLGFSDGANDDATRVIVIDRAAPVGFMVDRIDRLMVASAEQLEKDEAGAGGFDPNLLSGVVKGAEGDNTIKILNPERLLSQGFAGLAVSGPRAASRVSISNAAASPAAAERRQKLSLVSFDLGQQEYALPLERVREIIPLPQHVSEVSRPDTAILGVVTLRDRLLPLVSLRALLGLPEAREGGERGKVVVLSIGNGAIGMVADRTREILHVDPAVVDPAPALLTRGAGDAEITAICRLEQGKRLVAVLSPDRLFRSDLVRRLLSEQTDATAVSESQTGRDTMADEQFIVFRLGEQEYGLPIAAVNEIARPPEQITRLPKAPAFIDGVMNLRGSVVPIVDLRRRFELAAKETSSSRRILVVALGGGKTGFLVDGVSEVLKMPSEAISPAPEVSSEQMRLISRVANLEAQGRMILLIDPTQLLDRVEADVLAKFERTQAAEASEAS